VDAIAHFLVLFAHQTYEFPHVLSYRLKFALSMRMLGLIQVVSLDVDLLEHLTVPLGKDRQKEVAYVSCDTAC